MNLVKTTMKTIGHNSPYYDKDTEQPRLFIWRLYKGQNSFQSRRLCKNF